jgi:hypothetical protein
MKPDPLYMKLAMDPVRQINGELPDNGIFWVRTSPKPTRDPAIDYVSWPIASLGRGLPNPDSIQKLNTYHDRPIKELVQNSEHAAELRQHAEMQIAKQLATVNQALRNLYEF